MLRLRGAQPCRGRLRAHCSGDRSLGRGGRGHHEVEGQGQGDERDEQWYPQGGAHDLADDEDDATQVRVNSDKFCRFG